MLKQAANLQGLFFQDRLILVSFVAAFVLNIILWAALLGKFGFSPEPIPLHFNVIYGIDYVDSARKIYQMPAAGLVILLVNLILSRLLYEPERYLSILLGFGVLVAQLLLLIAVVALLALQF